MNTNSTSSQPVITPGLARKIHDERFNGPGTLRSDAYKAGALARLLKLTGEAARTSEIPYKYGTTEADAWLAGTDAAEVIYRIYLINQPESDEKEATR